VNDPGWTVNSHAHGFDDALEDYYAALLEDPDTPTPEWLSLVRGDS
jgi:hypothetical protein